MCGGGGGGGKRGLQGQVQVAHPGAMHSEGSPHPPMPSLCFPQSQEESRWPLRSLLLCPQLVLLCSLLILAPHRTPVPPFFPLPSALCGVPTTTKGRFWSWAASALPFMSGQRMLHETMPSFQNTQSHWAPTTRVRGKPNTLTIHATQTV